MNPLSELVELSAQDKLHRGLLYTPAEIMQQPATWEGTFRLFVSLEEQLKVFLQPLIEGRCTVYLVGAGSSDYIGHTLTHLLRKSWRCEVSAVASTDLLTNRDDLILPERNYLWISFSRSGESPEGVAVLEQALAKNPKVRHLIVSCNQDGRMVKLARQNRATCLPVVLDDAVNDRSLAMTSSFTNMVVFGQAMAHLWHRDGYAETLEKMREAAGFLLEDGASLAAHLASVGYQDACFIGAGALNAAARESALKLTELTSGATRAISETTLGLRHGPMSSLNHQTLLVILLSKDERRQRYDGDLLAELKRKQLVPCVVAVGGMQPDATHSLSHPSFDGISDDYRPAVDVLFGQMLGLFASLRCGLKPDSPSPAGVISRVVDHFTIYA